MMFKRKALLLFLLILCPMLTYSKTYKLKSPGNRIQVNIQIEEELTYSLYYDNSLIFENNKINLLLGDQTELVGKLKIQSIHRRSINDLIKPIVPNKNSLIKDECIELELKFKNQINLVFRAYDHGFAYRIETEYQDSITVLNEEVGLNFNGETFVYFPEEKSFYSHFEAKYPLLKLDEIEKGRFCQLPVLFTTESGIKIVLSETDLYDYPCLFMKKSVLNSMIGIHPPVVAFVTENPRAPDRSEIIKEVENYIARSAGKRTFPWRTFIISEKDKDILESNLNYILATPGKNDDYSWVKPGKVAWDWYNSNNIFHVDFVAGINNDTYKYYIDFASKFGVDYIILDEGWSKTTYDVTNYTNDINVKELVRYGQEKNVDIILWLLWKPLDLDMENIMKTYQEWGVKGIKVDFMQRADQEMVNFYERTVAMAAKYKLLVDFHGAYKPSGLRRAYPNLLTCEGVMGMEHNKWSEDITPEHTLILPFTRMAAGPMDFTPGSMRNSNKDNFSISFTRPMSMGTRSHQVAMYIVYESPLQMMCESPTIYYKESECASFITSIPVTWDETIALDASIGEFAVIARRNGENWYIGAMTNSTKREIEIDLSFLPQGNYKMESIADGFNAHRNAEDYVYSVSQVKNNQKLLIRMSSGGGWAAVLKSESE